jgi:hypothetical protein
MEGIDPVAVQPEAGTASVESFGRRLLAIEQMEAFVRTVAPGIPPELRDAVGCASWPADHPESRYAAELRSLERTLQTLRDRQPEVPPTSNDARPPDSAV